MVGLAVRTIIGALSCRWPGRSAPFASLKRDRHIRALASVGSAPLPRPSVLGNKFDAPRGRTSDFAPNTGVFLTISKKYKSYGKKVRRLAEKNIKVVAQNLEESLAWSSVRNTRRLFPQNHARLDTEDRKYAKGQGLLPGLESSGRVDWIRTSDPLTPSQVRYQTAPPPGRCARKNYSIPSSGMQARMVTYQSAPRFDACARIGRHQTGSGCRSGRSQCIRSRGARGCGSAQRQARR